MAFANWAEKWDKQQDEQEERDWQYQLKEAIAKNNTVEIKELVEKGMLNLYNFTNIMENEEILRFLNLPN